MIFLFFNIFNMIEFKINGGDLLTALIALLALWYTIYSTKENQKKSVLPYFIIEPFNTKIDTTEFTETPLADYRVLITKENKISRLDKWGLKEREIIKKKVPCGTGWTYDYNLPVSMKLTNTGKSVAVSFSLVLDGKFSPPQKISVNEEVVVSVLLEDPFIKSNFFINFRDIYGNQYKEKIEFYDGRLHLNPSLKKVRFSKIKYIIRKMKSRRIIREQTSQENNQE